MIKREYVSVYCLQLIYLESKSFQAESQSHVTVEGVSSSRFHSVAVQVKSHVWSIAQHRKRRDGSCVHSIEEMMS